MGLRILPGEGALRGGELTLGMLAVDILNLIHKMAAAMRYLSTSTVAACCYCTSTPLNAQTGKDADDRRMMMMIVLRMLAISSG